MAAPADFSSSSLGNAAKCRDSMSHHSPERQRRRLSFSINSGLRRWRSGL